MPVPMSWYVLAGAATLINGGVLGYLSWRERNAVLRLWAWAWLSWAAAIVPLVRLERSPGEWLAALACGLAWVVSTLCFLGGSYEFSERRLPRAWLVVAAVCASAALALGIDPRGGVGMLPLVLFQAGGLATAGVLIIRAGRGRAGAWLGGLALIGLGLHLFDAPVLAQKHLLPWGFVAAAALEMLAALGMLALYYEHGRAQLLAAQRALSEKRRIEALGRVAGGVAHDFNNMLTVMQGHVELLRLQPTGAERESSLQALERAIAQAGRLTAQLLAFGRRSVLQPETIDVRAVVADTLELLRKVIPAEVTLRFRCGDGAYSASMDRSLLEQIVLNLVTNARDAIMGAGHVFVDLERLDARAPTFVLRVEDDGHGMDEHVLSQIFEPFFTTKGAGKGTGLGLASVQGAVSQLGGQIHVDSRLGQGTRFEVSLPLRAVGAPPAAPVQRAERERSGLGDMIVGGERARDLPEVAGHRLSLTK